MGWKLSSAEQTYIYSAEPSEVADAVQTALNEVGKIKSVSRATGVIDGVVRKGLMAGAGARVLIQISRVPEGTKVHVQTSRDEGLATSGGAQKGLSVLAAAFAQQPVLGSGNAAAGW